MSIDRQNKRRKSFDWTAVHERLTQLTDLRLDAVENAERTRAILDERARRLAQSPVPVEPVDMLELLTFSLGRESYAIETHYVLEIARLVDFTMVPGAPAHLVGVTNLRGEIIPIFDLGALVSATRPSLSEQTRLLVLGDEKPDLGLTVDAARDVVLAASSEVQQPTESMRARVGSMLRGVTNAALLVLDGKALLEDPRLFVESQKTYQPPTMAREP